MDSTVPADLLKLKDRLEAWRANRKYARQPIPDEFRKAAAEMTERHAKFCEPGRECVRRAH
jgi:hypothetical protein